MKYSKKKTESFARAIRQKDCLVEINKLILEEGYSEGRVVFNADQSVLNMDQLEAAVAAFEVRELNKSMDSAFIAVNDVSKQAAVLVEFRFNYQSLNNINRKIILEKVEGSLSVLGPCTVYDFYYFVFNSDLKQQAISRFYRNWRLLHFFAPVDLDDIKQLFFT